MLSPVVAVGEAVLDEWDDHEDHVDAGVDEEEAGLALDGAAAGGGGAVGCADNVDERFTGGGGAGEDLGGAVVDDVGGGGCHVGALTRAVELSDHEISGVGRE